MFAIEGDVSFLGPAAVRGEERGVRWRGHRCRRRTEPSEHRAVGGPGGGIEPARNRAHQAQLGLAVGLGFLAFVADCRIEGDQPDFAGPKTVACPFEGSASSLIQCLDQYSAVSSVDRGRALCIAERVFERGGRTPPP